MTRYSVQPRDWVFVKGYWFLSFAKYMGKNICKTITKNLIGKYNQNLLDYAKQSATDTLKTSSKRVIQKAEEATGDLIGNKIANKITKASRSSLQNNSETITNEHDKKYLKKDIYLQKKDRKLLMI